MEDHPTLQQTASNLTSTEAIINRFRLRYVQVKNLGSKLAGESRNQKIIRQATSLPEGNCLSGRAIYWFVTTTEPQFVFDAKYFQWQETAYTVEYGVGYYLNRVKFRQEKGKLGIAFENGDSEHVICHKKSSAPKPNKRVKLSPSTPTYNSDYFREIHEDEEFQSIDRHTPPCFDNNQPMLAGTETPFDNNNNVTQSPSRHLRDNISIPHDVAIVVNILLVVPDALQCTQVVENALTNLGTNIQFVNPRGLATRIFTTENGFQIAVSSSQQRLYSRINSTDKHLHVLVLPYGKLNRYHRVGEYLRFSSESIVLLENDTRSTDDLIAISDVTNIGNKPNYSWQFIVKTFSFNQMAVDYTTLNRAAQTLFLIEELREASKGGAICKDLSLMTESLARYILERTLQPVTRHVVQNIYVCFKYEPRPLQCNEYAAVTLTALGVLTNIDDILVVHGSVLVYIRCPAYIPWYILMRKYEIFCALEDQGLTEVYECFISDVEESIQRAENEQFVDELTFLKEQMISDDVSEQPTPSRFAIKKSDLTLEDPEDLNTCEMFDVIDNKKSVEFETSQFSDWVAKIFYEDTSVVQEYEEEEVYTHQEPVFVKEAIYGEQSIPYERKCNDHHGQWSGGIFGQGWTCCGHGKGKFSHNGPCIEHTHTDLRKEKIVVGYQDVLKEYRAVQKTRRVKKSRNVTERKHFSHQTRDLFRIRIDGVRVYVGEETKDKTFINSEIIQ